MAEPELGFAGLLRQLRAEAKLTQEELAEAAGVSPRSVSDLERGVTHAAHKDTAVLLAGALGLPGPARELFVAAARGKAPAAEVLAALRGGAAAPGGAVDAPLEVTDRPRAQARRLGQLLLGQPGLGPQLPQQAAEPQCKLLRHGAAPPPQALTGRTTTGADET